MVNCMDSLSNQVLSLSLLEKCAAAVVGILAIHAAFRVLTIYRRADPASASTRLSILLLRAGYIVRQGEILSRFSHVSKEKP